MIRDSQNIPPVLSRLPAIISGRAPMRLTSCEATPDATMIMATIGRYATPVRSALYPHTFCRKSVRKKNMPNSPVPMHRLTR